MKVMSGRLEGIVPFVMMLRLLLLLLLLLYHFPKLCTLTACIFTGFKVLGSISKGIRLDQWTIYVWLPLLVEANANYLMNFQWSFSYGSSKNPAHASQKTLHVDCMGQQADVSDEIINRFSRIHNSRFPKNSQSRSKNGKTGKVRIT
jgi:hypothetical protein